MIRLAQYLLVILRWRRLILLNTLAVTVLAIVVSLILPKSYTGVARLLPPAGDEDIFGLSGTGLLGSSPAGRLGRLARLSAMSSEGTPSDIMVGILGSRTIMDRVAAECSIAYYYRIKPSRTEAVRRQLAGMSKFRVGDEGIVTIVTTAKTPHLAAKIANTYVAQLDSFLRNSNMSRGHVMRVFLERRLAEVDSTLRVAQESLRVYQERTRMVSVDDETKAAIDAYAELKSKAYLKQAELEAVSDAASEDNPFVVSLRRELDAYQEQLRRLERGAAGGGFGVGFAVAFERLPAAAAEFARRYRDYRIQEEAYAMLCQQYEYAKVLEARDAPTLTVLDYAVPPQRKTAPKRMIIVGLAFLFSLTAGMGLALLVEYYAFLRRERPEDYAQWASVGSELSRLSLGIRRFLGLAKNRPQ